MHTRCVLMLAGWLAIVSLPAWAGTDWTKVAEAFGKSGSWACLPPRGDSLCTSC